MQGDVIKGKKPEVIKENSNAMEIDTQPQAPDAKGKAPNISKDSAGSLALSPGAKNETAKGQPKEQYLPQKGVSATKGKSPKNPFNLADFIPGPSQDDSSVSKTHPRRCARIGMIKLRGLIVMILKNRVSTNNANFFSILLP